jgi:hypothetical protein
LLNFIAAILGPVARRDNKNLYGQFIKFAVPPKMGRDAQTSSCDRRKFLRYKAELPIICRRNGQLFGLHQKTAIRHEATSRDCYPIT